MTYNIRHANPPSKGKTGEIDLEAIAKVIREEAPDLVALQEVDVYTTRSGKINQAEVLASKLGMHVFFGRAIDFDGGQYGVAILSKYPIKEAQVLALPETAAPQAEDRVMALGMFTLPGGKKIRFASTHLDVLSETNRLEQIKAISSINTANALSFIVAGDFNALPESETIAELDKQFTRTCLSNCGQTFPADVPVKIIDYIAFTKEAPFQVLSQRVIQESYASDHLPLVATLQY